MARADDRASARDAHGYVALFTEDGVIDGAMGRAKGRAELAQMVERVWAQEPAQTLHLTLNAVVEDTTPEPTVTSIMLMVSAGSPPTILGATRVAQKVRRMPTGWQISERRIANHGAATGSESHH